MPEAQTDEQAALAAKLLGDSGALELQSVLDKLPAAAYTCDAEGLITYFNRRAVEIWGREPRLNDPADRYCGSFRLFSAKTGEPLRHEECWMALALRDKRGYNRQEIIIERPDGRRVHALAHANPITDPAGKLIGALNILIDLSDSQRAEQQAQTWAARLAAIVESSEDAIVGKNLDGIITSWNQAAERMYGYTAEEAVGRSIMLVIPEERRDEETQILARLRRGERVSHFETVRRHRDGRLLDVSLTISPIRGPDGSVIGAS
ncbi:MAG TPA: PAS domain S-box protein, partial [Kiloniellales bacterium]|nr:PAS domain S-box protein [Kiloniellales bacterium]